MTSQQQGGLRPSRRTLVKGAAWSVPVVAVAGTAPAFAASQEVEFRDLGRGCKLPGNSCYPPYSKGYMVAMLFCTTVRGTITVDFGTATGTLCGQQRTWQVTPDPMVREGSVNGEQVCYEVNIGLTGEPDSANCPIAGQVPFTWESSNGLTGSGTAYFSSPATPPCDDCNPPADPGSPAPAPEEGLEAEETVEHTTDPVEPVTEDAPAETEAETVETEAPAETQTTDEAATTAGPDN